MKNMLNEFKDFINKGNLVALAIVFLMAQAFAPVVGAFADGVIMNIIARIFGKPNFDDITIGIGGDSKILIGTLMTTIVNFLIVAAVCFLIVKAYDKWQKKEEAAPAGPSEVDLLTEIRDSLRNR